MKFWDLAKHIYGGRWKYKNLTLILGTTMKYQFLNFHLYVKISLTPATKVRIYLLQLGMELRNASTDSPFAFYVVWTSFTISSGFFITLNSIIIPSNVSTVLSKEMETSYESDNRNCREIKYES